jgi:5'-deoxynucleotidase YfbR-like HD superfamily hydrolase
MGHGRSYLSAMPESFISYLGKLKMIPRSGWISHGVGLHDVESVAEHTFSTSSLAMVLADIEISKGNRVNVERVIRMGLLHDLTEALTFDISKSYLEYLGSKGEVMKRQVEQAAWSHIIEGISSESIKGKYARAWSEFDAEESLESQIVHAADKLDILFQIVGYLEKGYRRRILADLWVSTNRRLMKVKFASVQELRRIVARRYASLR